ncbi:DUF397 domain-containing protein [Streptomyces prunicolor]|uniref:DUF397 domain-containing protein n=1 Tax=Streptomyces prunicolor TaxID=67348 RepID=UPI0033DC5B28
MTSMRTLPVTSESSGGDGDCVEVASCPSTIHIRDSKNTQGPQPALTPATWTKFIVTLR